MIINNFLNCWNLYLILEHFWWLYTVSSFDHLVFVLPYFLKSLSSLVGQMFSSIYDFLLSFLLSLHFSINNFGISPFISIVLNICLYVLEPYCSFNNASASTLKLFRTFNASFCFVVISGSADGVSSSPASWGIKDSFAFCLTTAALYTTLISA